MHGEEQTELKSSFAEYHCCWFSHLSTNHEPTNRNVHFSLFITHSRESMTECSFVRVKYYHDVVRWLSSGCCVPLCRMMRIFSHQVKRAQRDVNMPCPLFQRAVLKLCHTFCLVFYFLRKACICFNSGTLSMYRGAEALAQRFGETPAMKR